MQIILVNKLQPSECCQFVYSLSKKDLPTFMVVWIKLSEFTCRIFFLFYCTNIFLNKFLLLVYISGRCIQNAKCPFNSVSTKLKKIQKKSSKCWQNFKNAKDLFFCLFIFSSRSLEFCCCDYTWRALCIFVNIDCN